MTDQTYIGESGEILSQPLTWDGEPLYSQETVREGLFDRDAFAQMRGQLALEAWEPPCGSADCARYDHCLSRSDCPCGMADEP